MYLIFLLLSVYFSVLFWKDVEGDGIINCCRWWKYKNKPRSPKHSWYVNDLKFLEMVFTSLVLFLLFYILKQKELNLSLPMVAWIRDCVFISDTSVFVNPLHSPICFCFLHMYSWHQMYSTAWRFPIDCYSKQVMQHWVLR